MAMTISSQTNRWAYNGDGATTVFAFTNKAFASSDVTVYVDGAFQVESTDYTVSGVGDESGGNVTFVSAPPSGTNNVVLIRDVPKTQDTDLPLGGQFPASTIEDALDKLTVLVQQNADRIARALVLADADPEAIGTLPAKSDRASMFLGFDAGGDPIAVAGPASELPVTAFGASLIDDINAGAARATLGLGSAATEDVGVAGASVPLLNSSVTWSGSQTMEASDEGSGAGPDLTLHRISASPAASDKLGRLVFRGRDGAANDTVYGYVGAQLNDPTNPSEDGQIEFASVVGGTLARRAYVADGLVVEGATGGDQGAGSINAASYFLNGGNLMTEDISGHIGDPEAINYNIVLDAKYPFTIEELTVKTSSGSCTATLKINGVNVTGIAAVSCTTTENTYTATANDVVALGDDVVLTLASLSSPDNLMFTIKVQRTG
jgi:hypothetical protein